MCDERNFRGRVRANIFSGCWVIAGLFLSLSGLAETFCLLAAESYYDQLYCEIKAQGQGKRLPSLYDFQKNNEQTQAFLLKRPAARLGIEVVQSKRESRLQQEFIQPSSQSIQSLVNEGNLVSGSKNYLDSVDLDGDDILVDAPNFFKHCDFHRSKIECNGVNFQLVGNRLNNKLENGVLAESNKMNIPNYTNNKNEKLALTYYLKLSYRQYIKKMIEIGLGGSTFSYTKFVYLYHDVTAKGIDFVQRFETMFGYLKEDKRHLAISEKLPTNIQYANIYCEWLDDDKLVCDGGTKNYIYQRVQLH